MTAKIVDEVSASLSSIVDSIPKDVCAAERGQPSETAIVFKEEAVGEDAHEGEPNENQDGKNLMSG